MFNINEIATSYELPPAGDHVARCFKLIDLGTQSGKFNGRNTRARKLMAYWELLGADRREDDVPFAVSKIYTASMHEKAHLRRDIDSWNGTSLSAAEAGGFSADWMLDRYCRLQVTHTESNDNVRAGVSGISPLPDDFAKPEPVDNIVLFSLIDFDADVFNSLSSGVKGMIMASPEWKKLNLRFIANPAYRDDLVGLVQS